MVLDTIVTLVEEVNWLISLIMALVITIIGNFATPWIKNIWITKSGKRLSRKIEKLEEEKRVIQKYSDNPLLMNSYLVSVILRIFIIFALINIFDETMSLVPDDIIRLLSQIAVVSGYYVVFMLGYDALTLYSKVKNSEKHIDVLTKKIEKSHLYSKNKDNQE